MSAVNTNDKITNIKSGSRKLGNILLKVLICVGIAAVVIFALVAIYKILEYIFVATILLIGFCVVPRRWR